MPTNAKLMLKQVFELRDQIRDRGGVNIERCRVMARITRTWVDAARLQLRYKRLRKKGAVGKIAFLEGESSTCEHLKA
jgi:hypothetical protein